MLYIFLDESGNFDFSGREGRQYFIITGLSVFRPFPCFEELLEYRHDLWESGQEIEYFHANNDQPHVRKKVFEIICKQLGKLQADSIILEKRKTYPQLQKDRERFYKTFLGILLKYILKGHTWHNIKDIVMIHDRLAPEKRKRLSDAIKDALFFWADDVDGNYYINFIQSKASFLLQIVDYINWAIARKWEYGDQSFYDLIQPCIKSERDIFNWWKYK